MSPISIDDFLRTKTTQIHIHTKQSSTAARGDVERGPSDLATSAETRSVAGTSVAFFKAQTCWHNCLHFLHLEIVSYHFKQFCGGDWNIRISKGPPTSSAKETTWRQALYPQWFGNSQVRGTFQVSSFWPAPLSMSVCHSKTNVKTTNIKRPSSFINFRIPTYFWVWMVVSLLTPFQQFQTPPLCHKGTKGYPLYSSHNGHDPTTQRLVAGAAVVSWDLGKPRVLRRLVGFQEELRNRVKWKLISRNRNWKEYHNQYKYMEIGWNPIPQYHGDVSGCQKWNSDLARSNFFCSCQVGFVGIPKKPSPMIKNLGV